MRPRQLLDLGSGTLRITRWRGHDTTAHLTPFARRPFSPEAIDGILDRLREQGYHRVLTSALAPDEQAPFLACGFAAEHRLVLLVHDLESVDPPTGTRIRRGRRRDRDAALELDRAAFAGFWQLDHDGLEDALTATPLTRFRIVRDPRPAAYAISGRAGDVGYLQRIAVAPSHHRRGVGRALVADSLRWMQRRGAREAFVNTAEDNAGALAFYAALGFQILPEGLAVLGCHLNGTHGSA